MVARFLPARACRCLCWAAGGFLGTAGVRGRRKGVKSPEEIMEILEAFDLTGSCRAAAELAGCDHHTVRRYVEQRGLGREPERMRPAQLIDPFLGKVEEWVDRSRGRVGADVVHLKLTAMGYAGSWAAKLTSSMSRFAS